MLFFVGRGQASKLILPAVVLLTAACASSLPLSVPGVVPGPAEARPEAGPEPELRKEVPHSEPRARPKSAAPARPSSTPAQPRRAPVRPPAKPVRPPAPRLDSAAMELAITRQHAHGPLAEALARRTGNAEMADRAAIAVVREAERLRLSPSLLAAVLLIENAPLDSVAVSTQGAIGMMQIMPIHIGSFGCEADLVNVESNICHGARLLKHLVRRTGSVRAALRSYNGCVRGRNTPRCHRYPTRVLTTASRLRREILATASVDQIPVSYTRLAATTGSTPSVVPADTAPATAGSAAAPCTTLVGCLRYRWSLAN